MLGRPIFAALILAASPSGASAGQATLGGISVTLPPPAGFCELDSRQTFDSRIVTIISGLLERGGIKLLGISADCGQLADGRAGGRRLLDDLAEYLTQISAIDKSQPIEPVAQTCTTLRSQGKTIAANQLPDFNARLESTVQNIKINETRFIGVLAEDADACYAGLTQKARTEIGTDKTQVTTWAITIIRNRSIVVDRFAVYQNPDTVSAALARLKADVAALIAANP
jgi:hypothetical protein